MISMALQLKELDLTDLEKRGQAEIPNEGVPDDSSTVYSVSFDSQ